MQSSLFALFRVTWFTFLGALPGAGSCSGREGSFNFVPEGLVAAGELRWLLLMPEMESAGAEVCRWAGALWI
jgi:hypothetical protein